MEKIIEFLTANKSGVLATAENNRPHARPQHVHLIKDGRFYFTTSNKKDAFKQLKANPFIEFVVTTEDFTITRISGQVIFTDDLQEKQMVVDHAPLVKKGYESGSNPTLEVFYLEKGEASIVNLFSGQAAEKFSF